VAAEPKPFTSPAPVSSVVVVGASVGGLHVVEQLRSRGYRRAITLVGAEPHLPYDRPPLSKQLLLGSQGRDEITFRRAEEFDALGVELRLGATATGWDGRELTLADGSTVTADRLVVATGVRARPLPGQPEHPAVGTLRTVEDAEWLAHRLRSGGTVAVVGGGFIGAEVASAARQLGCDVVMFEATELPMQRVLGDDAARLFGEVLATAGVNYRGSAAVGALVPDGDTVLIEHGAERIRAHTVVVGIGGIPESAWLGVEGLGGIACDARGRAAEVANAYAIGDVAAWPDPHTGAPLRTEHWTSARTQAALVAADIAAGCPDVAAPDALARASEPEYFWTDQFGLKVQVIGRPDRADRTIVVRPAEGTVRRSAVLYLRDGTLVGCALFSAARLLARFTALVRDRVDEAGALAALE
jgi:NADPH-dependent 2,4-dienoyl-CoA reductase/sulfur reductase-like enzyme